MRFATISAVAVASCAYGFTATQLDDTLENQDFAPVLDDLNDTLTDALDIVDNVVDDLKDEKRPFFDDVKDWF
jgi:hypothetical protein